MYNVRESWTDARLDDFATHVDRRFDEVDRRLDKVDRRLDKIDHRLERFDERLGSIQKTLVNGFIGLAAAMVAGFGGLMALIATQL
jgi:hypothetical protein